MCPDPLDHTRAPRGRSQDTPTQPPPRCHATPPARLSMAKSSTMRNPTKPLTLFDNSSISICLGCLDETVMILLWAGSVVGTTINHCLLFIYILRCTMQCCKQEQRNIH